MHRNATPTPMQCNGIYVSREGKDEKPGGPPCRHNGHEDCTRMIADASTTPRHELLSLADTWGLGHTTVDFARRLDREDPLKKFRKRFVIPKVADLTGVDPELIESPEQECIYMSGHLLGAKPRAVDDEIHKVLDDWGKRATQCFRQGHLPASTADLRPKQHMAEIVGELTGADRDEIVFMNGLTINLHLLMGEQLLREEDIYDVIDREGDTIALLLLCGVQYQTGQALDIRGITSAARKKGCIVLWDLAHAVCNVELRLNEWEVDLAAWCTYKYMNCGPGCTAVAYVSHKFRKGRDQAAGAKRLVGQRHKDEVTHETGIRTFPVGRHVQSLRR
ncbi:hypothetical protein MTO96_005181 [Rhipicephalus appendiculatus]